MEVLLQAILDAFNAFTGFFNTLFEQLYTNIFNLFQNVVDFFISIVYFFNYVFEIFKSLFSPIEYIFYYLKAIFTGLIGSISYEPSITFNDTAMAIFNAIPNFSVLMAIIGGMLSLLVVFATIKILSH